MTGSRSLLFEGFDLHAVMLPAAAATVHASVGMKD
jgi:hypothetical protein